MKEMVSLEEAQQTVLAETGTLPSEVVKLADGYGRVIAEEIRAYRDEPVSPRATMDGYALCSTDTAVVSPGRTVLLKMVGTVSPGGKSRQQVKRGEAVRVLTGAAIPEGADAVVPQEMTEPRHEGIRVGSMVKSGDYVLPAGAEFRKGQQLISPPAVLGPAELTALAALGFAEVRVQRQPRVAVLATGDELVEVGQPLAGDQVFASNLYALLHLVNSCGGKAIPVGISSDKSESIENGIRRGMAADMVVTTGGTGRGDKDLLTATVAGMDGRVCFRGVAMTPGKQTLFATLGGTLLFGLPGRTAAAHIAFHQIVRPALLWMLGIRRALLPEITARLDRPVKGKTDMIAFIRGRLFLGADGPQVRPVGSEIQGVMAQVLAANALIKVPPERTHLEAGELVQVQGLNLGLGGLCYFAEYPG